MTVTDPLAIDNEHFRAPISENGAFFAGDEANGSTGPHGWPIDDHGNTGPHFQTSASDADTIFE